MTLEKQRYELLEEHSKCDEHYCCADYYINKSFDAAIAIMREREAKLVDALKEVNGLLTAHEYAICTDAGATNWSISRAKILKALAAINEEGS